MQFTMPLQSPVLQALPPPLFPPMLAGPVPAALKLQFVLPHTRPCQSEPTVKFLLAPVANLKPLVDGGVPAWVAMPGYIVSAQRFETTKGTEESRGLTHARGARLIWCMALTLEMLASIKIKPACLLLQVHRVFRDRCLGPEGCECIVSWGRGRRRWWWALSPGRKKDEQSCSEDKVRKITLESGKQGLWVVHHGHRRRLEREVMSSIDGELYRRGLQSHPREGLLAMSM